jgi:hypothetical protein
MEQQQVRLASTIFELLQSEVAPLLIPPFEQAGVPVDPTGSGPPPYVLQYE